MYVQEIHEALDKGDLNRVWELMFQRSMWVQNNHFHPDEATKHAQDSKDIMARLIAIQENANEEITQTMKTRHASRAYGQWRSSV